MKLDRGWYWVGLSVALGVAILALGLWRCEGEAPARGSMDMACETVQLAGKGYATRCVNAEATCYLWRNSSLSCVGRTP